MMKSYNLFGNIIQLPVALTCNWFRHHCWTGRCKL